MKLKTLIIDDEPIALEKLHNYVEKVSSLELVGECNSCLDAVNFLTDNDVDLIFTDISMPDLNGLEFVESLLSGKPMVVFITAFSEYAVDGFRLSAIDYLLKPYRFVDFQRAANKAVEVWRSRHPQAEAQPESLFIKVESRYVRVSLSDIIMIKGYGEYLQIYLADRKTPLLTLASFASMRNHLTDNFLQVHRSYMVNMNRVCQIERNRIWVDEKEPIPVGDSYRQAFLKYVSTHSADRNRQ